MKGKEAKKLIPDDAEVIIDDKGASLTLKNIVVKDAQAILIPGLVYIDEDQNTSG